MSSRTPHFGKDDPVVQPLFFGEKAHRARDREYREAPIEVLPGIFSNSEPFLKFKDRCSKEFTAAAPASVDDWGRVTGNGVRANFYGMRHVNGYGMSPATWPMADNAKMREDANLANKPIEEWHANVFRSLVWLFFTDLQPTALRLRRGSSSCSPFFVSTMDVKKRLTRNALADAKAAGELLLKGEYEKAFLDYHCGGCYYVVYRDQSSDAIVVTKEGDLEAKVRMVADFDYAISGGRSGSQKPASKSLDNVDFPVPKDFYRVRRRTAMGGPLMLNASLMPIAQAVRKRIYDRYAPTYHHTSRAQKEATLRTWVAAIATDVTQHDQYWPSSFLLDLIADELLNMGFAEWWVELYRTKGRLPVYVSAVSADEGHTLIGDWRKPDLNGGLWSGNAFTDLEGTLLMTAVYAIMQIEHVYPSAKRRCESMSGALAFMDSYLRGNEPIVQKSKSDDALVGITDPALERGHVALMEKLKKGDQVSPYMLISYEHGGAFLGDLLLYSNDKSMKNMVVIGNINSWAVNQWSPEYGVNWKVKDRANLKRPYPGLAWKTMAATYGSCPVYGELHEIAERAWFDCFGYSYSRYREELLRADERALAKALKAEAITAKLVINDLTDVELDVIASPDRLQYKYTDDDVRSEVRDHLFQGLTIEEVEPYFNSIVPR